MGMKIKIFFEKTTINPIILDDVEVLPRLNEIICFPEDTLKNVYDDFIDSSNYRVTGVFHNFGTKGDITHTLIVE